jgi:antitoxin ParD1/3/4
MSQLGLQEETGMPTVEHMTITLPEELAKLVRSRVASGDYSSESDVVEDALLETILPGPLSEAELVHWMNTEGVRRFDAMRADPSQALTIDEAFAGLCGDHSEISKEG